MTPTEKDMETAREIAANMAVSWGSPGVTRNDYEPLAHALASAREDGRLAGLSQAERVCRGGRVKGHPRTNSPRLAAAINELARGAEEDSNA